MPLSPASGFSGYRANNSRRAIAELNRVGLLWEKGVLESAESFLNDSSPDNRAHKR
jgi:hypothetical protein